MLKAPASAAVRTIEALRVKLEEANGGAAEAPAEAEAPVAEAATEEA